MTTDQNLSTAPKTTSESSPDVDIPAVVAVVVAKDPGAWFEDMLLSLVEQDYENLSVLVVDAGSEEPIASRVAASLPEAYIHRLAGDPGWSVAANQALELVSGSPFLMYCHDDVVLERSCVSTMITELYKSNSAIVGPKLVEWDDPRRLLQVGMSTDRFGVPVELVERGEFDQEQYDSPRDVFYIPGGVQLIRADLLSAVGGFDEGISFIGEDIDLCWRAHAVGARVRVVPKAIAKHIESADQKASAGFRRRLRTRHRFRSVLTNTAGMSRFVTIPLAAILILLEGLYALFNGRRKHAKEVMSAITWNLSRLGSARHRRKELDKIRKNSDADVRKLQVGGSAQINAFWREKFEAGQTRLDTVLSTASSRTDSNSSFHSLIIFGTVMLMLLVASRGVIADSYRVFGQIPAMGNSLGLVREWFGGWRSAGTGGSANAPLGYLILGTLRSFFFFAPGLFDRLLLLLPLVIGYWGGSRIGRPYGSPRLRSIAGALYVLNPIVFFMIRAGRWDSLVIWAALPFLLTSLMKLLDVEPYAGRQNAEDNFFAQRTLPVRMLRFGFLVAVVAIFAPSVVVVSLIMGLGVALTCVNDLKAFRASIAAAVAAVIVPAVLLVPWSYDVVSNFSWSWLVGSKSPETSDMTASDILFFRSSDVSESALALDVPSEFLTASGAVLPAFALGALILGKKRNPRLLASGLGLCLIVWMLLWLEAKGLLPAALPAAESMMAIAASALILFTISVGIDFEQAFAKSVARTRYLVPSFVGFGLVILLAGSLMVSSSGRWGMPESPRRVTAASLLAPQVVPEGEVETTGRILWLGDPSVVPIDMYPTEGGIPYAVSTAAVDVRDKWVPGPIGGAKGVGRQLDLAYNGGTSSLGSLIASYGIEYVVLSEQLARNYQTNPADRQLEAALERQLDLQLDKSGNDDFTIYQNTASGGVASALPNFANADATTALEQIQVNLSTNPVTALPITGRPGRWLIEVPEDQSVFVALPFDNLNVSGVRSEIAPGFDSMSVIEAGEAGTVELDYGFSFLRTLYLLAQFLIVSSAIVVAQTRKGAEQ